MMSLQKILGFGLIILCCNQSIASELVYTPQNSAFGGSASDTQVLLSKANAQNTHKDDSNSSKTALERFQEQLERRILNMIAANIVNDLFDDEDGFSNDGVFATDDFSVSVLSDTEEGLTVEINDIATGATSTIEIPQF